MSENTAGERTATEIAMTAGPSIGEYVVREAAFLLDRLEDFYNNEIASVSQCNEWDGHIAPSIARLRMLITPAVTPDSKPENTDRRE